MFKKLFHSALWGLAAAGVILFAVPKLNNSSLFSADDIVSFNSAVRIASPAVVNVYNRSFSSASINDSDQLQVNNLGSGVIMTKDGYILTNKHVIQNADQIVVALQNGNIYEANLIGSDNLTDLAVLKIKATNLSTIPQNKERQVRVGDIALAIGNPYNLGQSVSQGIISAVGRSAVGDSLGRQNFIQTDASINRGNSGGALINSAGELVGISTLSIGKTANEIAEGLNFAIPISIANDVLYKIIRDGRVIRGYFGVQSEITANSNGGIVITGVTANSPAAKAGIQVGDVILRLNKQDNLSIREMMQIIVEVKTSHFFACLDRLRLIQRWSLMRNIEKENLAEHSLQVAFVAQALAIIKNQFFGGEVNPERIAVMAMYHDTSEIFTGDLPTPIKYFNSEITHAYKDIEAAAELHLISLLPTELQDSFAPYLDSEQFSPEEKHLVKQADLICAYIKAQFELEHGNHEFKTAKKRLENLMEQWHSQEMDYFLQVFLPSFGRSIDEIAL